MLCAGIPVAIKPVLQVDRCWQATIRCWVWEISASKSQPCSRYATLETDQLVWNQSVKTRTTQITESTNNNKLSPISWRPHKHLWQIQNRYIFTITHLFKKKGQLKTEKIQLEKFFSPKFQFKMPTQPSNIKQLQYLHQHYERSFHKYDNRSRWTYLMNYSLGGQRWWLCFVSLNTLPFSSCLDVFFTDCLKTGV